MMTNEKMLGLLAKAEDDIKNAGDPYRREPSDGRVLEILDDLRLVLVELVRPTAPAGYRDKIMGMVEAARVRKPDV